MGKKLLEKDIERPIKRWARDHGWYVRKYANPSQRAAPDNIFIKKRRVVFIEMKRPGQKPTENQWDELYALRLQGIHADWTDDVGIGKAILQGSVSLPAPDDRTHPRERLLRSVGGHGAGEDGVYANGDTAPEGGPGNKQRPGDSTKASSQKDVERRDRNVEPLEWFDD